MNKYVPHVYVIPEDDANRQLANGFEKRDGIDGRRIQIMPPARGWSHVRDTFQEEYIPLLRNFPLGHVVLLIDFDGEYEHRRALFEAIVPDDLKARVFVVGTRDEPEILRQVLGTSLETIGDELAAECAEERFALWAHEQLVQNEPDRLRLAQTVRPFLF